MFGNNHIIEIETKDQKYIVAGRLPFLHLGEYISVEVDPNTTPMQITDWHMEFYYNLDALRQVLLQVKGIGKKRANQIVSEISRQHGVTQLYWSLEDFIPLIEQMQDVPNKDKVIELLKIYSFADEIGAMLGKYVSSRDLLRVAKKIVADNKIDDVRKNYYLLVDYIPHLPLHRLDEYVRKEFSIKLDDPNRIEAFIKHGLMNYARSKRITKVPLSNFTWYMQKQARIDLKTLKENIQRLAEAELIYTEGESISLNSLKTAEENIATHLLNISNSPVKFHLDDITLENLIAKFSVHQPDEIQKEAIKKSFYNKVHIITGGPGTGKSTVLITIYKIAEAVGYNPIVLTPTGKAADRLKSVNARTIHFALGWNGIEAQKQIHNDFVIIDEASMLDLHTLELLLSHLTNEPTLIMVGDANQLPPVEAGNPFLDLINCGRFELTKLQNIYRQGEGSKIITLANEILSRNFGGIFKLLNCEDIITIQRSNPEEILLRLYTEMYNTNPYGDFIILTPLRNEGLAYSASYLNNKLKKIPGPKRVMCVENDYTREVYNGETGFIVSVDEDGNTTVNFNNKVVEYDPLDYAIYIDYCYATTVHKAQGSEYDVVLIPMFADHLPYWTVKLLYTAVTRAKKKLVFVSDETLPDLIMNVLYKREPTQETYLKELLLPKPVEISAV